MAFNKQHGLGLSYKFKQTDEMAHHPIALSIIAIIILLSYHQDLIKWNQDRSSQL